MTDNLEQLTDAELNGLSDRLIDAAGQEGYRAGIQSAIDIATEYGGTPVSLAIVRRLRERLTDPAEIMRRSTT